MSRTLEMHFGRCWSFVMMTAFGSIETAVEAMRAGAESFLVKPLDINAVLVVLQKVLEKKELVRETETLRARVQERYRFPNIIGDSPELQSVFDAVPDERATLACQRPRLGNAFPSLSFRLCGTRFERA